MKFCKDCSHAIPPKNPAPRGVKVDGHVGWLCSAPHYNMVTGEKTSNKAEPALGMRSSVCGPGAVLFTKR